MSDLNSENAIASLLAEIHHIQRRLSDLNARLARGPKMIQVQKSTADRILLQREQVRAEHRLLSQAAKLKEDQLAQSEAALTRRKTQMQEAKTNKEFEALKLQVQADEATNGLLADETFLAMDKAEKFMPNITAVEQELQTANAMLQKTQATVAGEQPAIEVDMAQCAARLKDTEQKLPPAFREIYSRLAKSMGGEQSLAQIYDQKFCGGCRQLIPINFIAQVLHGKPVTCKSCGRLLYMTESYNADES